MKKDVIDRVRKILLSKFKKYQGQILIDLENLTENKIIIKEILFDKVYDKNNKFVSYKLLDGNNQSFIDEVIRKVDFSKIDLSDVDLRNGILCGYNNAKLYTDNIYAKSLNNTYLEDVTFVGNLDDIDIRGTKFLTTNNARINLNNMKVRSLEKTNCQSLEIDGELTKDIITNKTKFNKNRHQNYIMKKQELDMEKQNINFFEKQLRKIEDNEIIYQKGEAYKLILKIKNALEQE